MATSSASVRRSGARGVGERTVRERRARRPGAASSSGEGRGRGVGVAWEEGGARGGGGARRRHGSRPRAARSLPARPPATRSPAVRPPREQGKGAKGAEPILRPKEKGGAPRSRAPRCSCGARARVPHRPHLVTPPPRIRHLGGRTSPCRRGSAAPAAPRRAAATALAAPAAPPRICRSSPLTRYSPTCSGPSRSASRGERGRKYVSRLAR